MNKRNLAGAFGAVLAAGIVSASSAQAQERQSMPRYPLTSTPDSGTVLNPELAARVRRLAEYVMTRSNQPGLLSYNLNTADPLSDYETVRAQMAVDGKRYTVYVANANENSPSGLRELIRIWERPDGTRGAEDITYLIDYGLDGKCNFGRIPEKHSPTGQEIIFDRDKPGDSEHSELFQNIYKEILDRLIAYYEKKSYK